MKPKMRWTYWQATNRHMLTCLICGYKSFDLVTIQEHVVEHGYSLDDHRRVTRRSVPTGYIWTMPDGRDWLHADWPEKEVQRDRT